MSLRLCVWIVKAVSLLHKLTKCPLSTTLKGHSAWSMTVSLVFLKGVQLQDICKAATWFQVFVYNYRLDVRSRLNALFGCAVLSSLLV